MIVSHTLRNLAWSLQYMQPKLKMLSYQINSIAITAATFYMYSDDKERCFHDSLARMYISTSESGDGCEVRYLIRVLEPVDKHGLQLATVVSHRICNSFLTRDFVDQQRTKHNGISFCFV